jgi:hypothetical protein
MMHQAKRQAGADLRSSPGKTMRAGLRETTELESAVPTPMGAAHANSGIDDVPLEQHRLS